VNHRNDRSKSVGIIHSNAQTPGAESTLRQRIQALPLPLPPPGGRPRFLVSLGALRACPSGRLPSLARMRSSSCRNIVSRASFRLDSNMTSSVLIAFRPACLLNTSRSRAVLAIWVYTSSVRAPMNCGVALRSEDRHSSSMYWPIVYQRADLRRCARRVSGSSLILGLSKAPLRGLHQLHLKPWCCI
jgi:hypothetical protein